MADQTRVDERPGGRQPGSPRSARLGGVREQEILRATYELLGEVGYESLRLDAVATRARASKATLYRHWPGKAQLVADAVRMCRAADQECPDTGTLRGDLVAFMEVMATSMKSEDGPLFAGLVMTMLHDPDPRPRGRARGTRRRNRPESHRGDRAGPDVHAVFCPRRTARRAIYQSSCRRYSDAGTTAPLLRFAIDIHQRNELNRPGRNGYRRG
jgi:AcrR family transcriptional regulator